MAAHDFSKQDSLTAKGIAIILMLNYHLYNYEEQVIEMAVNYSPLPFDAFMLINGFGNICVAVFTFISSYGITKSLMKLSGSEDNIAMMCKQSAIRAGHLMWNFAIMYISLFVVWHRYLDSVKAYGAGWQGRLLQIVDMLGLSHLFEGMPTLCDTWWYMGLAFTVIALVPFLYCLVRRTGPVILLPALVLPFLGGMNYTVRRYYMVVLIGVVLASGDYMGCIFDWKAPYWCKALIGTFLIGVCVAFRQNPVVKEYFWGIIDGPIAVLFLWFSKEIINKVPVARTVLAFLGRHSMNIFFVHMFFYMAIYRNFIYSFQYAGLILLVLILVSLGYSIALEWAKKGIVFVAGKCKRKAVNFIGKDY